MKPLIESVARRIGDLLDTLRNRGFSEYCLREVSKLKNMVETVKAPLVPPRAIWDKYASLMVTIEEAIAVASSTGSEYAVHATIVGVKEGVVEFCNLAKKAYYFERAEAALPVLLGFTLALYKLVGEASANAPYLLAASLLSLLLVFLSPAAGLAVLGVLGALFIAFPTNRIDALMGFVLLSSSIMYVYAFQLARSSRFEKKLKEITENIQYLIKQGTAARHLDFDAVVEKVSREYGVPDTGVFKFLNKSEVLRYKAVLMMLAAPRQAPASTTSSG